MHKRMFPVVVILAFGPRVKADLVEFVSQIDGQQANECRGTNSPATGSGTFILDTATGTVTYDVTIQTDLLLGRELFAHVHGPAAPCVEAVVLYDLPLGSHKQGTGQLDAQGQADMLNELHYLNVHTQAVGVGEVRGQIRRKVAVPKVPTLSAWAAWSLALAMLAGGSILLYRRRAAVHPGGKTT